MTEIKKTVAIQFIKGKNENGYPEIRLFRDIDGKKGKAVYKISNPTTITLENFKSIQKMYLMDEEGELQTKRIELSISGDHITEVTSIYSWNSEKEFERFMRFSIRYSNSLINNKYQN
tara:strand:- start:207 stop:560 length:354 start_codon:yes stop_codon:yes gene_type:complete